MKKTLLSFLALAAVPVLAQALPILEDFPKALELSEIYGKPLVLVFTGSNWCEKSKKILKDILPNKEIGEKLKNQFIFVKVDFPDQNVNDRAFREVGVSLKEKYSVTAFPTILLLSQEGEEVSRLIYQGESIEEVHHFLLHTYENARRMQYEYTKASLLSEDVEGWERLYHKALHYGTKSLQEKILEKGVAIDQGVFFPLEKYAALVAAGKKESPEAATLKEKILKRDPDNQERAHLRLALLDFQSSDGQNPKEAVAPLDAYIKQFGREDQENLERLHLLISDYFNHYHEEPGKMSHAKQEMQ